MRERMAACAPGEQSPQVSIIMADEPLQETVRKAWASARLRGKPPTRDWWMSPHPPIPTTGRPRFYPLPAAARTSARVPRASHKNTAEPERKKKRKKEKQWTMPTAAPLSGWTISKESLRRNNTGAGNRQGPTSGPGFKFSDGCFRWRGHNENSEAGHDIVVDTKVVCWYCVYVQAVSKCRS